MAGFVQQLVASYSAVKERLSGGNEPPPQIWRGKRKFARYNIQVMVQARVGKRAVMGLTKSIGLGGLFVLCEQGFMPDTRVTLSLELEGAHGNEGIEIMGRVVYRNEKGMGIQFSEMSQADYQRLRDVFAYAVGVRREAANV